MKLEYLDFEQPIADLDEKIEQLRLIGTDQEINISEEILRLEKKSKELSQSIFSHLTAKQIVQLARHPQRPYTLDYIQGIFTDFQELHGDRHSDQASAIVGGVARFDNEPVLVLGHQKGRTTKEKIERSFGMPSPEAFRKALRLMKMAEKFQWPIFTFLDTPGASPGISAEEHNQSEAIARNLFEMAELKTPIICTVIGEGCSGGALGIGVGDRTLMLQYSYYSVISPEGCASILWKSAEKSGVAAEAMGLTAHRLAELGLIDEMVSEPLGGAHRDAEKVFAQVKSALAKNLRVLKSLSKTELLAQRYQRWLKFGC